MHVRSVHKKIKPYGCDFCDMRTAYKHDATKHMRKFHQKELLAVKAEDVKVKRELSNMLEGVKAEDGDALVEAKKELKADFDGGPVAKEPKAAERAAAIRPSRKRSAKRSSIWYGDDESDDSSDVWNDSLEDDAIHRAYAKRSKKEASVSKEVKAPAKQPQRAANLAEAPLDSFLREEDELNRRFFAGKSVRKT
ncbi:hypothetical protein AAVH_35270 [Aphelenchoides avenae]|nr:hypothetical protein AAVH_35270 [Aphelenchus avenae]